MKLSPNRKCINCNSLGPQYVCTNFWTFVCTTCSGMHCEFTHQVKSVSMAKFTKEEVDALQRGGNQRAREIFLKDWDMQRMRLPDSGNADRIRQFIKKFYVDKKYAGGRTSDKPSSNTESLMNHEEDQRRASLIILFLRAHLTNISMRIGVMENNLACLQEGQVRIEGAMKRKLVSLHIVQIGYASRCMKTDLLMRVLVRDSRISRFPALVINSDLMASRQILGMLDIAALLYAK